MLTRNTASGFRPSSFSRRPGGRSEMIKNWLEYDGLSFSLCAILSIAFRSFANVGELRTSASENGRKSADPSSSEASRMGKSISCAGL